MRENNSTQRSNRESKQWARVQAEMLSEALKGKKLSKSMLYLSWTFEMGMTLESGERQSCQIG